jgi:hypothetical protein
VKGIVAVPSIATAMPTGATLAQLRHYVPPADFAGHVVENGGSAIGAPHKTDITTNYGTYDQFVALRTCSSDQYA